MYSSTGFTFLFKLSLPLWTCKILEEEELTCLSDLQFIDSHGAQDRADSVTNAHSQDTVIEQENQSHAQLSDPQPVTHPRLYFCAHVFSSWDHPSAGHVVGYLINTYLMNSC